MSPPKPRSSRPRWPALRAPERFPEKLVNLIRSDLIRAVPQWEKTIDALLARSDRSSPHAVMQCMRQSECTSLFGALRLVGTITSKYRPDSRSKELQAEAIRGFLEADAQCSHFNRVGWRQLRHPSWEPFLYHARRFISKVIGDTLPPWEDLVKDARHGPGASVGVKSVFSHPYFKWEGEHYSVTDPCVDDAWKFLTSDERWVRAFLQRTHKPGEDFPWAQFAPGEILKSVVGNSITTVPKDSSKDRTIAIEPLMNMMLQLGVDGFIRHRLKRWGVNLDDQTRNSQLAYEGSVTGRLATLDLKAASDSVSLRLVKLLLPEEWFRHLCAIRSPRGELPDGRIKRYSKISSMGNGTTFALESLVFTAIVYASARCGGYHWRELEVAVYGDDLVVPEAILYRVMAGLQVCGFTLNAEKSFTQGPFRESCGTDWVRGTYVRSVYLKEKPQSYTDLYLLHNQLLRWEHLVVGCEVLHLTRQWIERLVPHRYRYWGPMDDDDLSSYLHSSSFVSGSYRRVVAAPVTLKPKNFYFALLLASLRGTSGDPPRKVAYGRFRLPHVPDGKAAGTVFEATLRIQPRLKVVKAERSPSLGAPAYGRTVNAIARVANARRARRMTRA